MLILVPRPGRSSWQRALGRHRRTRANNPKRERKSHINRKPRRIAIRPLVESCAVSPRLLCGCAQEKGCFVFTAGFAVEEGIPGAVAEFPVGDGGFADVDYEGYAGG